MILVPLNASGFELHFYIYGYMSKPQGCEAMTVFLIFKVSKGVQKFTFSAITFYRHSSAKI